MVDASLDGKKGENVILKQPSYRFESCPDYTLNDVCFDSIETELMTAWKDRQYSQVAEGL